LFKFTKTEEFLKLFTKAIPKNYITPKAEIYKNPSWSFWEKCDVKGNNPLQKALVKYILEGDLPYPTTLQDILIRIKKLDAVEQQSILKSIQVRLQTTDRKLMALRKEKSIALNEESDITFASTMFGIASFIGYVT